MKTFSFKKRQIRSSMTVWLAWGLLMTTAILTSCQSNGCYEETDVKVRCSFYWDDEAAAVSIDSLSVWGVGSDSLLYDNSTVSLLELELNPNATSTRFVVQVVANDYPFLDTLTFLHTNNPWFESMDCDCMVFSTLDTCLTTGRIFQSASLPQRSVTNAKTTHVVLHL
ncbi:MAG: hypothetical protein GX619_01555 [Bacteroidales bacterium]|jgi:hypothetical protein|nr:hypothetical protein [Bacteroidales bacterium]